MSARSTPIAPVAWKVLVAFGLVYVIWGSTYLSIRIAVATIPPFLMAGVRFLIAGTVMFAVARMNGASLPHRIEWRSGLIIGGLLLLGGNGGVSWSEQKLPSNLAALLVATVPLWMSLIEWLRPGGNRPTGRVAIGLVLGFVGMVVLVGPAKILAGQGVDLLSVGAITLATILWAIGSIYSRTDHARLPDSPLMATAVEMLAGGALLMLVAGITGDFARFNPAGVTTNSLLALGYLIVFGSLVAYTSYVWLLKVSTPSRVSTYAYVNPVVAVFLGWLVLGERLTTEMIVASPLILLAVILITTSPARQAKKAPAEEPEISLPVAQQASAGAEK